MLLSDPNIDNSTALAFCVSVDSASSYGEWHAHKKHQLVYAISGVLHLIVEAKQWLLPPQRAAWVPAGMYHKIEYLTMVSHRAASFDPTFPQVPQSNCQVFSVTPLFKELMIYCMQWGTDRDPNDSSANLFFRALAILSQQLMKNESSFFLPLGKTPAVENVIRYTIEHLDDVSIEIAARVSNFSARSLQRHLKQETGLSWQKFLFTARMMRAMELLSYHDAMISETALAVGYSSFSAFTQAFIRFTSETPHDYQKRIQ